MAEINEYYTSKLALFGEVPQGVDWNGEESKMLRFAQLSKIIKTQDFFSINDLGCGYGALHDFLNLHYKSFSYTGIDISENMISAAKLRYLDTNGCFLFFPTSLKKSLITVSLVGFLMPDLKDPILNGNPIYKILWVYLIIIFVRDFLLTALLGSVDTSPPADVPRLVPESSSQNLNIS